MAAVVRMPSVLAGATEAAIAHWLVSPGDSVSVGTPLAEIETEKALVEYAAEEAGVVGRLVLGEGDSAEIGDPIAVLLGRGRERRGCRGGAWPARAICGGRTGRCGGRTGFCGVRGPGIRDRAKRRSWSATGTSRRAGGSSPARWCASWPGSGASTWRAWPGPGLTGGSSGATLSGTSPARGPAAPAVPTCRLRRPERSRCRSDDAELRRLSASAAAGDTLIPHTPMRRAIARRLTESKATVPHFYLTADCAVDELLALRARVNETVPAGESGPVKVSVNDFVIAAVAAAFGDVPEANVTWTDEGLLQHRHVDISIAVATDAGLVTPVLRGVEGMRLSAIARESADLARRARDRKLRQHEIEGGSFAVSNLGMYGTAEFSAIINPPQSGILAVGAARQQPVVVDGALAVATVMRCTLSVDHRAIDGALAARWLAAFTARLENPLAAVI